MLAKLVHGRDDDGSGLVVVAVRPWLLTMLAFLIIVTYWPMLSLFLPRALGMMGPG